MRNYSPEHSEAVRLLWKARRIPFVTIIGVGLGAACVLSTFFSVWALGPANPIP
jgi:hypothetical protein